MGDVTIYGLAGMLGVFLYLGSYGALQLGLIRGSAMSYTLLNMIAAASILFSLLENWNPFSALIQIFWILISLVGIGRRLWLNARLRFTPEERAFLAVHLPTLPPIEAHRIMRLGRWSTHAPGDVLTRQGEPVSGLIHLAEGRAVVQVDGRPVATLGADALIGEMTLIHGGAATADVTVTEPARILTLPREALLAVMNGTPETALAVGHALQAEVQRKLRKMNAAPAPAEAVSSGLPA